VTVVAGLLPIETLQGLPRRSGRKEHRALPAAEEIRSYRSLTGRAKGLMEGHGFSRAEKLRCMSGFQAAEKLSFSLTNRGWAGTDSECNKIGLMIYSISCRGCWKVGAHFASTFQ